MNLAVLNPGGKDCEQHFGDFAGKPDDRVHAPVNHHAYAACTAGGFYDDLKAIPASQHNVLLLLRRDLKLSQSALETLRSSGKKVAVTWKESGLHQVADQLKNEENKKRFEEVCKMADGAISSTPEMVAQYKTAGAKYVEFIPTPYPVDDQRWDFSISAENRRGVFIGTREWNVPSRNHLAALLSAVAFKESVTVVNEDGGSGRRKLESLGFEQLHILEGRRPYTEYLREIAKHRLVFQLDSSAVPGQVAGDALLCRIPCVGGNSAVEQLAFPKLCGVGKRIEDCVAQVQRLIADPVLCEEESVNAHKLAQEKLSFASIANRLDQFFQNISK